MSRRICFIGLDNYPVLNAAYGSARFGGESVQQTLLARAFADRGDEVSMIVKDHGQPDGEIRDGIRVWKTFQPGAGLRGIRYVHPRLTSTWRALRRADADIYYHSCAGVQTGLAARFCARNNRHLVFRVAHDTDCIPGKELIRLPWDRLIYRYGLRRATFIAAQGVQQADLLRNNLGLSSAVINMAVELPPDNPQRECDIDVLWVNNLRPFKRPDLAIELAQRLPGKKLVMIGGPTNEHEDYFKKMRDRASQVPGLEFTGAVPFHEVNNYFDRARVFVNTSDSEGFPNSFLQAWSRRVPVVSFFDPDGLIQAHGLGSSPASLDEMIDVLNELLANPAKLDAMGSVCREFVLQRYSAPAVASRYSEHFEALGF